MRSDWLKDALFKDDRFIAYVDRYGVEETIDDLYDLKDTLVDQLQIDRETNVFTDANPAWKRSVTALIIRAKGRLKVLGER